jgi:hypothetical protein
MARETKADMLQNVQGVVSAKLIRPNTLKIEYQDGRTAIRFHHTDILTTYPDGSTVYNSGGWKTYTTKERMHDLGPARICQRRGVWYISTASSPESVYYDGITVDAAGNILNPQADPPAEYLRVKKLIAEYLKEAQRWFKANGIHAPEAGDCWICKGLHDPTSPPDCLRSHLEEKYFHGTLVLNALKERGYVNPMFIAYGVGDADIILRALRMYFKKNVLDKVQ